MVRWFWFCLLCPLLLAGEGPAIDTETWDYFQEIVLASEYQEIDPVVRKWTQPLRIRVFGEPSPEQVAALTDTIRELRRLSDNRIRCYLVNRGDFYNVAVRFLPSDQFSAYAPQPRGEKIYGYFGFRWLEDHSIQSAVVLIATDPELTPAEKAHITREEMTQAMGLINDSPRYPDSIFQVDWTETREYSPLDRKIIALLYDSAIRPGMRVSDIAKVLP